MSDLTALFQPRAVAVIGASDQPGKLGRAMADSIAGFPGRVSLVNPRAASGMVPTIAAAAESGPVDLAILCVPAPVTSETLRECAEAGVRTALVCAGGFSEVGGRGDVYARSIDDVVHDSGIRVLGPNTSGFFVPGGSLFASFVPGVAEIASGRIAVVAASGGVNHVLSFLLQEHDLGVSLGVGIGAGQDITAPDVLEYLAGHDATRAVILHVETVPDGPRLLAAVRSLAEHKPVVALIVGRNDVSEFATSHTGALATSYRVTRDALRQAGAIIVDDEEQAAAAAIALSGRRARASADPGVGLITGQAGPGLIVADRLGDARSRLPLLEESTRETLSRLLPPMTYQGNPVDTGRPSEGFADVVAAVANDAGIDVLGVYAICEPVVDLSAAVSEDTVMRLPVLLGIDGPERAVAAARVAARSRGIPILRGPTRLANGLAALVEDARLLRRRSSEHADVQSDAVVPAGHGAWDEIAAKDLLDSVGIATPWRRRCADRAEAQAALQAIGGAVAVKLVDAAVLHKSDIGGVVLGVSSPAELDAALDSLEAAGATQFLVESMAAPGVDVIVGARMDAVFGPIVALGLGGTAAEVLADVAFRTAPLTASTAAGMIDDLGAAALLRGFRGGPTVDEQDLGRVIRAVGALVATGAVAEIEVNPLRITANGLIALDAVVLPAHDGVTTP